VARKILVSAGEASGDLYASAFVATWKRQFPETEFFGCAGPRMQAEGVRPVVDMASLAVVGLVEVVSHIPRIYGEFRTIRKAIRDEKPDLAILTDAPDFHLRLLPHLEAAGVPVVYLVAPQAWAWRQSRVKTLRRYVERLLCIFPFEEEFFARHRVRAEYIGHPLAWRIGATVDRATFQARHGLAADRPVVALLPGSRRGEVARHWPTVRAAAQRIRREREVELVLGAPPGFRGPVEVRPEDGIRVVEGQTWDLLAHADLALAASGTVTIEAALLGCPMVTYYRVTPASWLMGKLLVRVPYYTMVNLVAGKAVVPELIQGEMTAERLAREAMRLLDGGEAREEMKRELKRVAEKLATGEDPMERAVRSVAGGLG
jgi:lipid-A-disaccharide synthase